MVTTINYSTSAHSTNVNLTKCKTWGLATKLIVTYSRRCLRHTFGHTDLVTASRIFTWTPAAVHKFTCFLLHLQPPFWHSPGSPELSYVLRYCPFTLPVRWQHSTGFTNPVSCVVLEKEWQKRRRGGQSNPFPLKTECVVQQWSPAGYCSDNQDACTNLPYLSCKSNLHSGTPQLRSDIPNFLLADALFLKK